MDSRPDKFPVLDLQKRETQATLHQIANCTGTWASSLVITDVVAMFLG